MLKFLGKYFTNFYLSKWPVRAVYLCVPLVLGVIILGGDLQGRELMENARTTATASQVSSISKAVHRFKKINGGMPGDIEGVNGCSGFVSNPDGIVGNTFFYQTLKPCYNSSTPSAALLQDESIWFWQQLLKADLISDVDDGSSVELKLGWRKTMPEARVGGGFVAGYAYGKFPENISPQNVGMNGTILVLKSSPDDSIALDTPEKQPVTPSRAAQIDRKMDDGKPNTGFVQAYGAPSCFKLSEGSITYAEENPKKDCGLIFRIAD